ncbi:Predicted transporter (major facilitator superfamily) [Ceraceosorus bombacis]|uniref:Predicted transporter (Major facilitator superfamily) n=1 Tax=Ceraceosorus bombacis TaxID=401625 RepID=A0A0P1B8D6_9BASI|nr:Predicted transporter (major facilitator superfamily) [Ceraceosorus bombacis]
MSQTLAHNASGAPSTVSDAERPPHTSNSSDGGNHELKEKDVEMAENPIAAKADPALEDESNYVTGLRLVLIMTAVNLTVFLVALDQTIVSTAVPIITNQFQSFTDVGWYGSAYLLTSTAFQPLFGRLYSSFDVKNTYQVALFIFEIGSLICAVAKDSKTFIVGRAIAGLGLAGGYSGSMIIVNIIAPLRQRPLLTSLMGASYGIGATIGPLIGGALTSHATWRWCFYLNLVLYALIGPAVLLALQVPKAKHEKTVIQRIIEIDWLGSFLILGSLISLLLVLQWGGVDYAWGDSKIIGLIVGFVVIAIAFLVDQWFMGEMATIPFRLFKQRTVGFGTIVNFGVAGAYFTELYYLPIYFQAVRGSSAIRASVQMLSFIVAVVFAVTVIGGVVNKTGHYIPFLIVGTALVAIGGGILSVFEVDTSLSEYVGLQFLAGFGPGMSWMLPFIAASAALAPQDIALGSGIVIFFQTLGGTIFVSVAQSVFQNKFQLYLNEIPGADPGSILRHGISAFRETTPAEILPAVLDAANHALSRVWIIVGVLGAFAFVGVFGMELRRKIPIGASAPGGL